MTTAVANKTPHVVRREGGSFERREFKIAATQEAFRILSDGLYSDKVRAVIRELSTNAVDGHIMAGNDDAFEVHLPSYDEPWFSVRDYGVGMSHDDVMDLYSTYFGTNKAEELETTGCLGLGSKSPLSKVRSFTVMSRHEGMERHYIVMLNEDRIPEVDYLVEQDKPTTDTGMEIHMAVATSDIHEYARKAAQVYFHFDEGRRPRVINGSHYELPEKEILIEGNGWRMYKGAGTPTAVQGNVGYPISASQIKNIEPHHETVLSCHLELDFDNGSLGFTPSREHLTYNKATCESLIARLDEIVQEVNKTVEKRFDNCRTLWEARVLVWEMFWCNDADLRHLKKLADTGEITWQGQKIAGQRLTFRDIKGVEGWSFELTKKSRGYWSNAPDTETVPRRDRNDYTPKANVVWFEVDIPRGSYSRCQEYVRSHRDAIVYLVNFSSTEGRDEFCEKMGLTGDEFVLTSTLPKPAHHTRGGGKFHRSTSLVYEHGLQRNCRRLYEYWTETEVDLDDGEGGVYVEMKNNKVVDVHGKRVDPSMVTDLVSLLRNVGHGDDLKVIGVRPQVAKRFRKSDDWVDLFTYARNIVKIEVVQKKLAQHIVNAEALDKLTNTDLWQAVVKHRSPLKLNPKGTFHALIADLQHMLSSQKECVLYKNWRNLADTCNISLDAKPERDLEAAVVAVNNDYPVVELMVKMKVDQYYGSSTFDQDEITTIAQYVHLAEFEKFGG